MQRDTSAEPNLDILRALAVLMVLGAHVIEMAAAQNPALSIHPFNLILGRLGVLLFFVHTALVLNYSMARAKLSGWNEIRTFYIRRAFRIYPLAIATVILIVALQVPAMPWLEYEATGPSIIASVLLIGNLLSVAPVEMPMWSLPIEVQMYLALPIIYLIVRRRPSWALGLWLLSLPIAWLQPSVSGRLSALGFAPCFLGGVLAFSLARRSAVRLPAWAWLPTLLLIAGAYLVIQSRMADVHFPPVTWLTCLLVGAIIPSFAESTLQGLNKAAALIAKYSYGIYLLHVTALWIGCVELADLPYWLQWSVAGITLCVLTGLGYHYIEEPAMRLGSKLASRRPSLPQPLPEQAA